ncbi:hypothetical protein DOA20_21290, partial [Salmonella enterica subsp. enterica serovar Newport]|nr:hypothetical protein [Salmonella enterica subsp. enterica serovar Newport]
HAYGDDNSVTLKNYYSGENYQRFSLDFSNTEFGSHELHDTAGALRAGQSMLLADVAVEGSLNRLTEAMAAFAPTSSSLSYTTSEPLSHDMMPVISLPNK